MKLVYTVCRDWDEADKISDFLVENKLAACTNSFEIKSKFRWKGKVDGSTEIAMLIKTKKENVDEVFAKVKEMHSYDCPCLIVLDVDKGEASYLQWLGGSC